MVDVKFALIWQ